LAETRHFGHAAEACAVSQPALSMQIKELEDELAVSLVERRKSGIELTEQGEEIAKRARTILASVRDLVDYARHQEGVLSGVLKLGAIPSIAPYLLPAALPELQRRFPALNLQLRETLTSNLVHELVAGGLDLILIALPIDDPGSRHSICSTTGSFLRPRRRSEISGSATLAPRCSPMIASSCSRRAIACATKRCPIAIC
jgi:LysR family hydrogen peroxide-inducible transcriptional activator